MFCINVYKNAKEKLSLGYGSQKLLELDFQTASAINPHMQATCNIYFNLLVLPNDAVFSYILGNFPHSCS